MRSIAITAGILLASATALAAQDQDNRKFALHGRVIDAATKAAIPTAIVRVQGLNRAAVADSSGTFVLKKLPKGALWVDVGRLGYATEMLDLRVMADDTITVELKPDTLVLPALPEILGLLHSRRRRSQMTVRAFDAARLATTTALDLRQFLNSFAGPITPCTASRDGSADVNCVGSRGRYQRLYVIIDEMPFPGVLLEGYQPYDFEVVEYYTRSHVLRLYTAAFLERVARGKAFISPTL